MKQVSGVLVIMRIVVAFLPLILMAQTPDLNELKRMSARFAKTPLEVDVSKLSTGDRKALVKLVEAAQLIDDIFLTQYWSAKHELWRKLQMEKTPPSQAR